MKKKNLGGRPTKFTEKIITEIIGYIENGNSYRDACILVGISETCFQDWKRQGNKDLQEGKKTEFSMFSAKIEQAKLTYKAWLIQNMNKHAEIDGKLSLEILSRKWPDEYGRKDRLDIKAKVKTTGKISIEELHRKAKEQRERLEAERAKRKKNEDIRRGYF